MQDQLTSGNHWSRRRFLTTALGAATAPYVVPASALGRDGQMAPSDRITIGMLGVGNRGSSSLRAMRPLPDHQVVGDKRLVLERSATIRTLDAVNWIARYLDDSELQQAACRTIVELAHHRFLRHPNMTVFGPLLEKAERVSNDPEIIERARRYRLGL